MFAIYMGCAKCVYCNDQILRQPCLTSGKLRTNNGTKCDALKKNAAFKILKNSVNLFDFRGNFKHLEKFSLKELFNLLRY